MRKLSFWAAILSGIVLFMLAACPAGARQAAPPPPPAEELDPASAPSTSRGPMPATAATTAPAAPDSRASAAGAGGAPPPPAEGLDPATAPSTSRGPLPVSAAGAPSPAVAATPAASVSPATTEDAGDAPDAPANASIAGVFGLDFMQRALWAGLVVSGVCAFLGVYVILKRIVFVGIALSEMSSAGVALAMLKGFEPMVGSVLMMLAGVGLLSVRWGGRRIRQDAFIGIGYVVASATSILLISKSAQGEGSLLELLFGNILTVSAGDVLVTALALGAAVLFHVLFFKELLFTAFDPDTAAASGYRSRLWELALVVTIGMAIAFAIHTVGVLLTFSALVIPPVTALLLTRRMGSAFTVSILAGMLPVPIGLYISFVADLPSAATVVATSFGLLVIAGIVARVRHA